MVKTFLKWVGGKTQIIDSIISTFPQTINNYYEPFVGGGSVLFQLLSKVRNGTIKVNGDVYASDVNSSLIYLYINVRDKIEDLIQSLLEMINDYNSISDLNSEENTEEAMTSKKHYYLWVRRIYNSMTNDEKRSVIGSSIFIFLNKTCFRGLYRESSNGFNVAFGNYKNSSVFEASHLREVSDLLQNVNFSVCSFEAVLSKITKGDFVYMDPPYVEENDTSFVSYVNGGFSDDDHNRLFNLCDDMINKGVNVAISNSNVKKVIDHFKNDKYNIYVVDVSRRINAKKPDAKTTELIIVNNI
jgi:DNA adenine methylase